MPVTTLRAGIVIGHRGLSWEMTRQLVERLPLMVTPRWVSTRTQPIALSDVVRYLVAVLDVPETTGRPFEVGRRRGAALLGHDAPGGGDRATAPGPPPGAAAVAAAVLALARLVTDVDAAAGRSLVDSMVNEVVVEDDELHRLVPFERRSFDERCRRRWPSAPRTAAAPAGLLGRLQAKLPMSLAHQVKVRHDEPRPSYAAAARWSPRTSVVGAGLLGVGAVRPARPRGSSTATTMAVAGV